MIKLRTFGGLGLHDSQGRELRVILAASKRAALLTYLAVATPRGFHRRDTLLALFWPELDQEHARAALRQALHLIRRSMTAGALLTEGDDGIALDRDMFWCDAVAFELLLDEGKEEEALDLYRGALLEGFHLSGCLEFERWLEDERRGLERRAAEATWSLAQQALAEGRAAQATQWGRRALAFSPDDEGVLRRIIDLLDRLGDRAGAIREYEAFAKRLQEDYRADPAPETTELIASVRAREQVNDSVLPSTPLAKQPVDSALASVTTQPRAPWRTRGRAAAAIVVLGAIAAAGATVMRNGQGDAPALDPTRVLVDIFQNETGDPSLDALGRMATDRVTAGLTYTGFVDVVSLGTPLLSREPAAADTGSTERFGRLQALARANGTGTAVWGSYYLQGDSLHFLAHVTDATTGEELATIEPVRGPVDAPVAAVERLRDRVMTTLATLTDPRLAKWMRYAGQPPTFEAYQAFVLGIELYATNGNSWVGAAQFVRAATLDSTFTMPLLWAITTGGYRGSVADSIAQQLNRRREQLALLDRHLLDYLLAQQRFAHVEALLAIRRVVDIAPNSEYLALAAQTAIQLNRPRLAVEFLRQGNPESGWLRGQWSYWDQLAVAYHRLGDHRQELEEVHRGQSQLPDRRNILAQEQRALAALGRIEQLNARIQESRPERRGYHMANVARELRVHGYGAAATEMLDRAIEWFEGRSPEQKRRLGERRRLAAVFLDLGRLDEAQVVLEGLLEDSQSPVRLRNAALAELGVVAARQGDREEASRISRLLEERDHFSGVLAGTPELASFESAYLRAGIAAALGERERAMELLRQSGPWLSSYPPALSPGHTDPHLEPLWDYPPFKELLRPKG